jgi:hypothetical protein
MGLAIQPKPVADGEATRLLMRARVQGEVVQEVRQATANKELIIALNMDQQGEMLIIVPQGQDSEAQEPPVHQEVPLVLAEMVQK